MLRRSTKSHRARRLARWSPIPVRLTRAKSIRQWFPSLIFGAVVLVIWVGLTSAEMVPDFMLPKPGDVAVRVGSEALQPTIWEYLWPTVIEALLGSSIAVVIGVPLGYLVAHSPLAARVLEPYIALTQAIPLIAVAPLIVLWIGYGTLPIAILCAVIAFFPMVTTSALGFRQINPHLIEAASLDGANGRQRLWAIELPLATPALLAGMRAGVVLSVTGAIVGEFVMGGHGLGTLLTLSRDALDSVGLFAVLTWIAATALLLNAGMGTLERVLNKHCSEGSS